MALCTPGTPRYNIVTPRKIKKIGPPDNIGFTAPTTPKSQFVTPKRGNNNGNNPSLPVTPECFSKVFMETPTSTVKRQSKDKFDEMHNLTVAVRIRPMNTKELSHIGVTDVVSVQDQNLFVRSFAVGNSTVGLDHIFQYDHIFWSCDEKSPIYSNQEDVFLTIGKPLLNSAFRGYNACLFAYGQTGSGKSFSMMGRNNCEIIDIDSDDFSGITPRFCRELFRHIVGLPEGNSVSVEVSYFEIYSEKIHDLLANESTCNRTALKVREHPVWGPYVVDLSVHTVKSYNELRNWLIIGNKNRATAATSMNDKSSRSHSIFSIELCLSEGLNDGDSSRRSKVSLVDLAGSERLGNSHNSDEKIRQGVSINKSLLTLGKVISSLADQKKQFVPYRDSVLTWLLRESLGGNSLTSMLATITPSNTNVDETLATLRYACQARSIVNRARVNENPHDRLIRELRSEVDRLRALRQDYERSSIGSSSSITHIIDSSNCEELDVLRQKLNVTELKLGDAERSWQKKFLETKETQMKELAEAEMRREELESKVRIWNTIDSEDVDLSPYRTNFLEELEGVLEEENQNISNNNNIEMVREWCARNSLNCSISRNSLLVVDYRNNKQTIVTCDDLKRLNNFENVGDFFKNLTWSIYKTGKKLTKHEILSAMNHIYHSLADLAPPTNEDNLSLLYAKVNRTLQRFESALMNSVGKHAPKSVTFDV